MFIFLIFLFFCSFNFFTSLIYLYDLQYMFFFSNHRTREYKSSTLITWLRMQPLWSSYLLVYYRYTTGPVLRSLSVSKSKSILYLVKNDTYNRKIYVHMQHMQHDGLSLKNFCIFLESTIQQGI